MFYVVIAGLFDCVISVFAMFLYIYFGKNKNVNRCMEKALLDVRKSK